MRLHRGFDVLAVAWSVPVNKTWLSGHRGAAAVYGIQNVRRTFGAVLDAVGRDSRGQRRQIRDHLGCGSHRFLLDAVDGDGKAGPAGIQGNLLKFFQAGVERAGGHGQHDLDVAETQLVVS